jgi:hypothetical protein
MNNPTILKVVIVILALAFAGSASYLVYQRWEDLMWKEEVYGLAGYMGATRALHDFHEGKLRLFVISGERSDDKYSGINDGPFEIWYPQYFPSVYPMRYSTEQMVQFYDDKMRYMQKHPEKFLETTNRRPNTALEPTPTAP